MSPLPDPSDTIALLVAYHPGEGLGERVRAALAHAARVVVVDNAPGPAAAEVAALKGVENVAVHRMGRNAGIAAALNVGLRRAVAEGYAWAILLDHDTTLRPAYASAVRDAVRQSPRRVGVVGVNFENPTTGLLHRPETGAPQEVPYVVSSGSMLRISAVRDVGLCRDDFFIDYVDVEYCLRMRRNGYAVVLSPVVAMTHEMGQMAANKVATHERVTANYTPARHYYMARNFWVTAREHARREPAWVAAEVKAKAKLTALTLVMEPARLSKLTCMLRGYADGFRGRMGEAPLGMHPVPLDDSPADGPAAV